MHWLPAVQGAPVLGLLVSQWLEEPVTQKLSLGHCESLVQEVGQLPEVPEQTKPPVQTVPAGWLEQVPSLPERLQALQAPSQLELQQ